MPQGPNHPKMIAVVQVSLWAPILWCFVRKLKNFEFGAKGPLNQKFGPGVQVTFKISCRGPDESIDTHIVRFCEKIAIFKFEAKGPLDPKFGPRVQIVSNMISGVQAIP